MLSKYYYTKLSFLGMLTGSNSRSWGQRVHVGCWCVDLNRYITMWCVNVSHFIGMWLASSLMNFNLCHLSKPYIRRENVKGGCFLGMHFTWCRVFQVLTLLTLAGGGWGAGWAGAGADWAEGWEGCWGGGWGWGWMPWVGIWWTWPGVVTFTMSLVCTSIL